MKAGSSGWNWKRYYPEASELSLMYTYSARIRHIAMRAVCRWQECQRPSSVYPAQPQETSDSYTQSFAHILGTCLILCHLISAECSGPGVAI